MINRRNLLAKSAAAATVVAPLLMSSQSLEAAQNAEVEIGDNGLHIQKWFLESFMDLAEDRSEAAAKGKSLALIFEQRGCPYCAEMHRVNFARKEIVDFITANFEVLQLDLWGSREVTDFDGTVMEERQLARKWRVNFTPTIVFIKYGDDDTDPLDLEVSRMPGYFKPYHFLSMFEYVQQRKFEQQPFQRFLLAKLETLKAQGINPDIW